MSIQINKLFAHFYCHSRLYLFLLLIAFLIFGLWPFNFSEKNNAVISPAGGLEIARHGTAYTASSAGKLQDLNQFAIYIDITTSSDGLNSFEKIFSYFINQEEMNFLLGQWKDGFLPVLRADQRNQTIKLGVGDALHKGERSRFLLSYDGRKFSLSQDGVVRNSREMGALTFSSWDKTYPLVVGMDANGRSQWRGTLYEVAVFDRALTSDEVRQVTSDQWPVTSDKEAHSIQPTADSRKKISQQKRTPKQENPPLSPFVKGGSGNGEKVDDRPLLHYVFRQENTYETMFRGKKALGVRDLGKGEPEDLVIPEQFMPYQRVYLGWDPDWMRRSSEWLDVIVNIAGFMPFGLLMMLSLVSRQPTADSQQQVAERPTNPPVSPFMKGGGLEGGPFMKGGGIVVAVILVVVAGFAVSLAIELLQAYLPSRDSSLRDLVTNVLGTFIGALVAAYMLLHRETATSD